MTEKAKRKKKKSLLHEIVSWIIYIGVIVAASLFIVNFVAQRTEVVGASMETTLMNGDQLIVDKVSYRFTEPKRFDIIVFP